MCICVVVALIQELISFECQMKRKIMKLASHKEEEKNPVVLEVKASKLAKAPSSKLFFCFRSVWLLGILSK